MVSQSRSSTGSGHRRTRSHFIAGVECAAFVALALAGAARTASACSLYPFGPYERPGAALFIGAATRDSLPVSFTRATRGFFGPLTLQPPPFGQVVQVERMSSRMPPDLRNAIIANRGRVLVVPWSYGADCIPISWTWGALWTTPDQRGVFGAVLRERDRWENGFPTFDVTAPWHVPYPAASQLRTALRGKPALSPDELLAMFDSIPQRGNVYDDPVRAKAIIGWAETHADQAAREPLASMVSSARHSLVTAPFNSRESPLAGTYRFVIQFAGADTVVLFGRTEARATSLVWADGSLGAPGNRPVAKPYAYYLYLGLAKEISELPTGVPIRGHEGFVAASFEPVTTSPDSTVWSAGAELLGGAVAVVPDPLLKARFAAAADKTFAALGRVPNYTPGRFVRRADGSVTLIVELRAGAELIATVRGTRLSSVSLTQ